MVLSIEDLVPNGWCQAQSANQALQINCRNEVLLDRCELMKREDLVLLDGAEQNKTRVLLAGDDCDGVGCVKVCARTG